MSFSLSKLFFLSLSINDPIQVESAISDAVKQAIPPQIDQISKQLAGVKLDIPITDNFAEVSENCGRGS